MVTALGEAWDREAAAAAAPIASGVDSSGCSPLPARAPAGAPTAGFLAGLARGLARSKASLLGGKARGQQPAAAAGKPPPDPRAAVAAPPPRARPPRAEAEEAADDLVIGRSPGGDLLLFPSTPRSYYGLEPEEPLSPMDPPPPPWHVAMLPELL